MDGSEIVKHIRELQPIVTTIVAGVPLGEIIKSIVLPSTNLLGKRMANRIERLFEKTEEMVREAGTTPQAVPDSVLVPLLQGASLTDNEDLHTMWAALLANAASMENAENVRPGFMRFFGRWLRMKHTC
jgi:hypothetical protein